MPEKSKNYFTKDDYLTFLQFAKKFDFPEEVVKELGLEAFKKKTSFAAGRRILLVEKSKTAHQAGIYKIHPLGRDIMKNMVIQKLEETK